MASSSKKLKRRKKTTAAELPEELVRLEILTRLPIKSAVRFKCVSKSWLSLFCNPQFIKQHLTYNSTQNPNDYDCLVANKHDKIVILSRYKETFALPSHPISLVGCVRGLVCLCHDTKLSLWNPAIHQSKEFTLPSSRCRDQNYVKGFGFDPVNGNYKVVVLSSDLRSASVYESNSESWIDVFVPDNVYLFQKRGYVLKSYVTIVKDCPYWIFHRYARDNSSYKRQVIVSTSAYAAYLRVVKFDVRSNEFKFLPQFYFDIKACGESYVFSSEFVDMNDCLTLIVHDRNSSKFMLDIYSLDGEEESCVWTKMYSIGPVDFHRRYWFVSQGFYGCEIVFHDDGMFFCYDHKTETIKRLSTTSATEAPIVSCFKYMPSLVFLQGMKSVYLTTQNRRTTGLCSRVPRRLITSLRS